MDIQVYSIHQAAGAPRPEPAAENSGGSGAGFDISAKPGIIPGDGGRNEVSGDLVLISEKGKPAESRVLSGRGRSNKGIADFPQMRNADTAITFKKIDDHRLAMLIIDKDTRKVLRQYPPEELQRVGRELSKFLESGQRANGDGFSGTA